MAADPKDIEKRLRDQSNQLKDQVVQMNELLTIKDVIIDEYDELIEKLDKKALPFVEEVNARIKDVSDAYKARVTAGCKNDLVWEKQESKTVDHDAFEDDIEIETWKVVKDPATRVQQNRYGMKYYRYPKNREYGSNVVDEVDSANIDLGTNVLILFDSDAAAIINRVKPGDFVTDDLDDPQVFLTGNLPTVVSTGTASYPGVRTEFSGFCTSLDNRIYSDGVTGTALNLASVGDFIYDFSGNGLLPANGVEITAIDNVKVPLAIDGGNTGNGGEITSKVATINGTVNGSASNVTFTVGIVGSYQSATLSGQPQIAGVGSSFLFVRGTGTDIEFDATSNPIDPVKIGTILRKKDYGKGHRIERQNNGDPEITTKWREIQEDPEPAVGSHFEEHWTGNELWPQWAESDGETLSSPVYVNEGFTITVSVGGTMVPGQRTYTAISPQNPSNSTCNGLDDNIQAAETARDNVLSVNIPKIDHLLKGSKVLRRLRDEDETQAWSYLQGIGYQNEKSKQFTTDADSLGDYNGSELDD